MRKIMNLAVLLLFLLVLVSCTKNTNSTKTYTISFASNNGEQYDSITIDGQQKINLPQPTKEGYSFRGWYPNQKYQDGTEVTSNTIIGKTITLYAKWEPLDITITFNLDNGYDLRYKDVRKFGVMILCKTSEIMNLVEIKKL